MKFSLDLNRMMVLFTFGERDLALALVQLEGYVVCDAGGSVKEPVAITFNEALSSSRRLPGTPAYQDSPGIWCYRIRKVQSGKKKRSKLAAEVRA